MKDADFHGDIDKPFFLEAGFIAQDVLKIEDISYSVTGDDYVDMSGKYIIVVIAILIIWADYCSD